MLKRFFLNMLSSFMGAWIALVLFGIVAVLVCIGLVAKLGFSSSANKSSVDKGSVLVINLEGRIEERETPEEFDYYGFLTGNSREVAQTLVGLKEAIAAAAENKNVAAIYLKCNGVSASPATLNSLRESLSEFKKSGKPVISYSGSYSMGDYYIATIADELCMNPYGTVALKGIGGTVLYYKPLLDKIGVNMQVVKVGTYKSAVEPYILPEMSKPARAQLDTLYGGIWDVIKEGIAERRHFKSPDYIDSLINNDFLALQEGDFDLSKKLVDALYFERSMDSVIGSKIDRKEDKLNFISPELLVSQEKFQIAFNAKNQIAVLFVSGEIIDGGGSSVIDYSRIVPIINELTKDENVKGMVMRVNSPGGSVYGSEQIGEALDNFQSKGKILAVSMGDYAASGGYWISSCANRIFANPLTITGSIGIFGLIPDISPLIEKIGIRPQLVSTNPEAAFPMVMDAMTPAQHEAMQKMVERGYDKFVSRVARGRKMSEQRVREIGEGRVWGGAKALEIGLVDEFGSLKDAIEWVAKEVGVNDYGTPFYPAPESSVWNYINQLGGITLEKYLETTLGEINNPFMLRKIYSLLNPYMLQAKMPDMVVGFGSEINDIKYYFQQD